MYVSSCVRLYVRMCSCTYVRMYTHTHAYPQVCYDIERLCYLTSSCEIRNPSFCMSQIPVPGANVDFSAVGMTPCLTLGLGVFCGSGVNLHSKANFKDQKAGLC